MHLVRARNVHQALPLAMAMLHPDSIAAKYRRDSRNGAVIVADGPVTTLYERPEERVLYWPERDANPSFHFLESLWMLDGRNDVGFVADLVSRMATFSDDGKTFNGAYGFRWRQHFGIDQLCTIIEALKANPDCRRQVLSIWDGHHDLGLASNDLPCNTHGYFAVNGEGAVDLTICNRSNDVVWGCYGANAVHMSFLLEFVARALGRPVGRYWQVSNNWHGYVETVEPLLHLATHSQNDVDLSDPYHSGAVAPTPIMTTPYVEWLADLRVFLNEGMVVGIQDPFFRKVAGPIARAYAIYKQGTGSNRYIDAIEEVSACAATDWRRACIEWYQRRLENFRCKETGI